MPLLSDYAITPDVFDANSYSNEEIGRLCLGEISRVLRNAGLVRDLRSGDWRRLFTDETRSWHRKGKELLKKLIQQGRLVSYGPALSDVPITDIDWCAEAHATHQACPLLGGIIVTERVKEGYEFEDRVEQIDRLERAPWWEYGSPSVRLQRDDSAYIRELEPVLSCSNSLLFIDPHLNPARDGYSEFANLLVCAGNRNPAPMIEIHRVCFEGSGRNREILDKRELKEDFRSKLDKPLRASGLQIEVYVWDEFHDRYLISNLVGISVPYGFDTSKKPDDVTTWTRLSNNDRDDVQSEFDPASDRRKIKWRFSVP